MGVSTLPKQDIKTMFISTYIPANQSYQWLNATIPDGYTFLCWVGTATEGYVEHLGITNFISPNSSCFILNEIQPSDRPFKAYYLVKRI